MNDLPFGLSISSLTVRFGERTALRSVSLRLEEGQLVALAGPNGSGKSTLLRTLVGIQVAQEGAISLGGQDLRAMELGERSRQVSWMPQDEPEGDELRVEEYVRYGRSPHLGGLLPRADPDPGAVGRALRATGTAPFASRRFRSLSGGERQRVRLARILAQESPLVLLDEPTAHLDIGYQLEVLGQVRQVARRPGRLVVVALHDLNLAARFADRIVVLSHGHLAAEGTAEEVLSPALLQQVWGVQAELRMDVRDHVPYLIPRLPEPALTSRPVVGRRVHVVAGGGSGREVLRLLYDAGYDLTAGALPLFDSDSVLAEELGVPSVLEIPFAPLSEETGAKTLSLLRRADVVVVAAFPVGPSNVGNLEAVAALDGSKPVFLLRQTSGLSWDFTGGFATRLRARVLSQGGTEVLGAAQLLEKLGSTAPGDHGRGEPIGPPPSPGS